MDRFYLTLRRVQVPRSVLRFEGFQHRQNWSLRESFTMFSNALRIVVVHGLAFGNSVGPTTLFGLARCGVPV